MARAGALVHQRLNAGHDWRGERRTACAGPTARASDAARSVMFGVGIAENVVMAPRSRGREQRHVRHVTHAIIGIAQNGLPGRLGISCARAANDAVRIGTAGGARAGSAAPCEGGRILVGVAKSVEAVTDAVAIEGRNQRARAGIIPRDFRNVGQRRAIRARVDGAPIIGVCACVGVTEIGATDSYVIRRGRKSAYTDAMARVGLILITTSRAGVARCGKHRNAFRDGLGKQRAVGSIVCCPESRFAFAIADAHDRGWRRLPVDQVLHGDQTAEGAGGAGARN